MSPSTHTWKFFRLGGFDQVRLDSGADLVHLGQLDQKLWAALSCPTRGVEFDHATLDLIDTDKDGRVRPPEVLAAVQWACSLVKDPGVFTQREGPLDLAAINDASAEGKAILASAKQILANLGKPGATSISVAETSDTQKIFAQTKFNGDGIVPVDAADDAATQKVIADVIACMGALTDRSGKPGVSSATVDGFFAACSAYADWWKKAETDKAVLPIGDATPAAAAALAAAQAKVDDYFARCRLAAYDARALGALNRSETEYLAIAAQDMTIEAAEIAGFPVARVEAGRSLPLAEGVNPAWAGAIAELRAKAVKPLLGDKSALSEADWSELKAKLAAHRAWASGKGGAVVEKLGLARVKEVLAGNAQAAIGALLAKDKALEPEANSIAAVDKLVRYRRDLHRLLTNYVNFRDFYDGGDAAIFQAGTLYLDTRSCDLVVRVADAGKHAALAGLSKTFLAYCDCTRKSTGQTMTVAAAFTNGDSDNLMVGRNGILYDRNGDDWDVTITKLIEQPISIRQAFFSPYKKAIRAFEEMIAKRAAAADAASTSKLTGAAEGVAAGKAPEPKKLDIGTVAAIGVAVGGISAALGTFAGVIFGLGAWMPAGIIAILLLISGPSMVIAWLKLRQRNLGPILDANGWAVNTQAKINVPFGRSLTKLAVLPPGSQRDLVDPYAESNKGRNAFIVALVTIAVLVGLWYFGVLHKASALDWLPKSGYLQRKEKAAEPVAAAAPAAADAAPDAPAK
ncbi:MAG: hypothetical protein EPO68_05500 [Planctomycetota bacterium]|nr:MAG: hypothetical protein EPO68_05500 [Planctomycetota bacterium]